ncbi:MAG: cyclopropane-fatty-acyl-phospholipid synthase family protein, partial [Planctomycetota bacterium]
MNTALHLVERGLVPLPFLRLGIRRLLDQRVLDERGRETSATKAWLEVMDGSAVAELPEKANEQHYEVPAAFYERALGPNLKYSSCYFETGRETLGEAEEHMLRLTCERAQLENGQSVLELGCGWGSLTLWMAAQYPGSRIVGVSNSASQRRHILERARQRGLDNVEIRTADMNEFDALEGGTSRRFDRIVSVEMFEHMRNWAELFGRARNWLDDDGRMFIHVFTHRDLNYPFEVRDETDWMSRYFFSGGMMPADDLLPSLAERESLPFRVDDHEVVN